MKGEKMLKKLRDFRMKIMAEIAELESYGVDISKRQDKITTVVSNGNTDKPMINIQT